MQEKGKQGSQRAAKEKGRKGGGKRSSILNRCPGVFRVPHPTPLGRRRDTTAAESWLSAAAVAVFASSTKNLDGQKVESMDGNTRHTHNIMRLQGWTGLGKGAREMREQWMSGCALCMCPPTAPVLYPPSSSLHLLPNPPDSLTPTRAVFIVVLLGRGKRAQTLEHMSLQCWQCCCISFFQPYAHRSSGMRRRRRGGGLLGIQVWLFHPICNKTRSGKHCPMEEVVHQRALPFCLPHGSSRSVSLHCLQITG